MSENRPLYVEDPNDPRLKSYSDSLTLSKWSNSYDHLLPGTKITPQMADKMTSDMVDNQKYNIKPSANPVHFNVTSEEGEDVGERYLHKFKKPTQPVKLRDPEIARKQEKLRDAGLYTGEIDGLWGPKSKAAWEVINPPQENLTPRVVAEETAEEVIQKPAEKPKEDPKEDIPLEEKPKTEPYIKQSSDAPGLVQNWYIDPATGRTIPLAARSLKNKKYKDVEIIQQPYRKEFSEGSKTNNNNMKDLNKDLIQALQMQQQKQFGFGGNVGAAAKGIFSGAANMLPGQLGTLANQGVDSIYGALDKNITPEEQSISGFTEAGASIAGGVLTGNVPGAIQGTASGLGQGISNGTKFGQENAGAIDTLAGLPQLMGGMGASFEDGGLKHYEGGGTHQENPNGGIPIGDGATVESGETGMDLGDMSTFIFSANKGLREKGMKRTFAAESKSIENKFKDRKGDAASNRAKEALLKGLAERQETLKAAKSAKLQTKIDELAPGSQEQFAYGGLKDDNSIAAFQKYALGEGADLGTFGVGKNGVDGKAGKFTDAAWDKYGKLYQSQLNFNKPSATTQQNANQKSYDADYARALLAGPADQLKPQTDEERILGMQGNFKMNPQTQTMESTSQLAPGAVNPSQVGIGTNEQGQSNLNRNLSIAGGQTLNSLGDFYGLAQGLRGPDEINLDRLSPEEIDLHRQREIARRQGAAASARHGENVRNFASSSGNALSNLGAGNAAINETLGQQLTQSMLNEETQNVGIRNQALQANQAIDTQEQLLNLQAQAKSQDQIQAGLSGIGGNAAQGLLDSRTMAQTDVRNEQQLNSMNAILKDFLMSQSGNITFKDTKIT